MLVSDHNDDKIYAYNMPSAPGVSIQPPKPVVDTPAFERNAAGDFTGLAAAKNNVPQGIWSDWATVWVADSEDNKIYAYDLKAKARAANHDFDTLYAAGNTNPTDIWVRRCDHVGRGRAGQKGLRLPRREQGSGPRQGLYGGWNSAHRWHLVRQ